MSYLIPSFKQKGDKSELGDYRGINIFNTILKLTTKTVTQKINNLIDQEEQQTFRNGSECTNAILIMTEVRKL